MITLRQLGYLVTLADAGSFVRAARIACIAQPTLSQQIKALEDQLGVRLLDRGTAGAVLTPIGRSIVAKARTVLSEVRDIEMLAARSANQLSGTLRFGTTPTLGPYLLSPIIAELHGLAPDLRLYVREGIPDEQSLDLSRGKLDVLLGPMPILGEDLDIEPLFREPLQLVCAIDCDLPQGTPIDPALLRGRSVLSLDPRHHLHRQVAELAQAYDMVMTPDYEGTSLDSLHQMAASGLGLSVLPGLYLSSDVGGSTGLKIVTVAGWTAHRSIALAWRRSTAAMPAFRLIAEQIQIAARRMLGS